VDGCVRRADGEGGVVVAANCSPSPPTHTSSPPSAAITYLHPWISEASMEAYYIDNVERYSKAVKDFREEKMGA
jgi:hypothetical protein